MSLDERDKELGAAVRTIEVLKRRVVVMQNGSQSTIQRQLEAARRREDAARQRRELTELRSAELTKYSRTLEDEVARRTLAMSRILDNVKFGFIVVGPDLRVDPEYTRSCVRLFSTAKVAGVSLGELLQLDDGASTTYQMCIEQLFSDILPEDVALAQAQTEFRIGDSTIRAEPSVMRDPSGAIEALLYTITDVTELVAAQRQSADNRMLLGILRNRESFRLFIDDTRLLLGVADEAITGGDDVTARRALHTLKGNSGCYDLREIVALIHVVEEETLTIASVASVRAAFKGFLREHASVLGVDYERSAANFEVSANDLEALRGMAHDLASAELAGWADRVAERPADVFLGPIDAFTKQLGARLRKEVELSITGGGMLVDGRRMRPVLLTLTHLLRNAVDHGIEPADERGAKGPVGRLTLALSMTPSTYEIRVSDDGRGIDVERVVERAIERGIITASDVPNMSERAFFDLVFEDGVSSAEATTEISGRGIGLSAVLGAVRGAGGTIAVSSTRGSGTTFSIVVPRAASAHDQKRAAA